MATSEEEHKWRLATWQKEARAMLLSREADLRSVGTVHAAEAAYEAHVHANYAGHITLDDCLVALYTETLLLAKTQAVPWQYPVSIYPQLLMQYLVNYRRMRAAEMAFRCGYPVPAFALLRDIKDQAITLAAISSGFLKITDSLGIDTAPLKPGAPPSPPPDPDPQVAFRKARDKTVEIRKAAENRAMRWAKGENSPLKKDERDLLSDYDRIFHMEVHGSNLSSVPETGFVYAAAPLQLGPVPDENRDGVYLPNAAFVSWLLFRSLPYLQRAKGSFGPEWAKRWHVLDDVFQFNLDDFERLGKPITPALRALIAKRFSFTPEETFYVEREAPEFYKQAPVDPEQLKKVSMPVKPPRRRPPSSA